MNDPILINIEQYDDCVCILHCKGYFVPGPEIEYVQSKINDIKRLPCTKVLVDFQDVTSMGSMGAAFIVGIYTSVMRNPRGRFVLAGVSPRVRQVLDLTRLNTVIPLASDLASGLVELRADFLVGDDSGCGRVPANGRN